MRINKKLRCIVLLALASGIAFGVSAQDSVKNKQKDIPDYQLGTFYVYGDRYKNKSALGGKLEKELKYIPATINIINEKDIQKQGSTSLTNALKYETGVVSSKSSSPIENYPVIRGFEVERSNWLVDGMKAFEYGREVNKGAQMVSPDIYGLEKVEVLKGPSSTFYGAGSLSGVINMQMKAPKSENFNNVEIKFGTKNEKSIGFDTNSTDKDHGLSVRMVGHLDTKNLYFDNSSQKRFYFAPSVTKKFDDKTTATVKAFYQSDFIDGRAAFALEKLKGHPLYGITNDTDFYGVKGWDKNTLKQWGFNYEISHKIDNKWSLHQKGFVRSAHVLSAQTGITGNMMELFRYKRFKKPLTVLERSAWINEHKGVSYGFDQFIKRHEENGENSRNTFVGFDSHFENVHFNNRYKDLETWKIKDLQKHFSSPASASDLASPEITKSRTKYNSKEYGIYVSHEENRGKWHYSAGVRRGFYGSDTIATTGQAGIVYDLTDELLPYVHWNNSFEPVDGDKLDEHGNTLKPQTGREWEVGMRYEPKDKPIKASISVFDLRKQNRPLPVYDETNPMKIKYWRSIGEIKSQGLDFTVSAKMKHDLSLKLSYSYLKTNVTKDTGVAPGNTHYDKDLGMVLKNIDPFQGKELPNAPHHIIALNVEKVMKKYKDGDLRGNIGIRYVGQSMVDYNNSYLLKGYTVYDASVALTRGDNTWAFIVNNVFNKKYVIGEGVYLDGIGYSAYPGDERSCMLSYMRKW